MKISYAITVCNELEEVSRLLNFLHQYKRSEDEICVLLDKPKASQELLDDANSLQNTSDKYTILNSKVYQFLSQPDYHMFMKNFGMGPSQNYTWDICVPTPACVGNSPQFCFGNQKICDQSSSLYPVLVGWAERNIGPNLHDFIHEF